MTVKELVQQLEQLDPTLKVFSLDFSSDGTCEGTTEITTIHKEVYGVTLQ